MRKVVVFCFWDSFVQKTTQQTDCSCSVTSNSQLVRKVFKSSLFISANTIKKVYCEQRYCIAFQDAEMCFLHFCRYNILLLGNFWEQLQKTYPFCFTYQHVDCLYTLFKYRFSGKIVVKSGQVFETVIMWKEPSFLKKETAEWIKCPV